MPGAQVQWGCVELGLKSPRAKKSFAVPEGQKARNHFPVDPRGKWHPGLGCRGGTFLPRKAASARNGGSTSRKNQVPCRVFLGNPFLLSLQMLERQMAKSYLIGGVMHSFNLPQRH